MQHELRIAAEKASRVDPQRQIAVDAGFGAPRDQSLGVAVDPAAFHRACSEKWAGGSPDHTRCNERPFHQPPAKRRDHHPLRLGLLLCSASPTSVIDRLRGRGLGLCTAVRRRFRCRRRPAPARARSSAGAAAPAPRCGAGAASTRRRDVARSAQGRRDRRLARVSSARSPAGRLSSCAVAALCWRLKTVVLMAGPCAFVFPVLPIAPAAAAAAPPRVGAFAIAVQFAATAIDRLAGFFRAIVRRHVAQSLRRRCFATGFGSRARVDGMLAHAPHPRRRCGRAGAAAGDGRRLRRARRPARRPAMRSSCGRLGFLVFGLDRGRFLEIVLFFERRGGCAAARSASALAASTVCTCSPRSITKACGAATVASALMVMVMAKRSSSARRCARFWLST